MCKNNQKDYNDAKRGMKRAGIAVLVMAVVVYCLTGRITAVVDVGIGGVTGILLAGREVVMDKINHPRWIKKPIKRLTYIAVVIATSVVLLALAIMILGSLTI